MSRRSLRTDREGYGMRARLARHAETAHLYIAIHQCCSGILAEPGSAVAACVGDVLPQRVKRNHRLTGGGANHNSDLLPQCGPATMKLSTIAALCGSILGGIPIILVSSDCPACMCRVPELEENQDQWLVSARLVARGQTLGRCEVNADDDRMRQINA